MSYQEVIGKALMRRSHSLYWGTVSPDEKARRRAKGRAQRQARKASR